MLLRSIKILLVLSVAAWAFVGAFGNLIDWDGTTGAVLATISMSSFEGGGEDWRATTSPVIVSAGAIFILILKLATGVLCALGALRMASAIGRDATGFQSAKSLALAGCGVAMFMLFSGWIVIAETWFELWRAPVWREAALQSAFRYCGMIGVIALFVARDD